jgi:signal transduction histidine kinase
VSQQRAAELRQLLAESGVALAIMSVASIGLGWLVAGRALRPLRTITTAARSISANNLHARLALDGPDDEVTELGKTFDNLLARLEGAFAAQRQFVANASHELRTPLARQRTLLEVALADPDSSAAALRHACARVLAAGGEQERLIEALLTLSRSQRGIDRREPVDVAAIAGEAVLAHRAQASALGVTVRTSLGGAKVMGDERLIERLVANLIDNAVRHNVHGGVVGVRTGNSDRDADRRASLTVVNSGPVIAPADVDRLFQPFQRAGGRTAAADGLGLGLSIVAAITAAHGARLEASAPPAGGLAISIAFSEAADPA